MRFLFMLAACGAACAATLEIPAASGALAIDGTPNEAIWNQARVLPLRAPGIGAPLPEGGEARAMVRGDYLCLSARLPEPNRISAYSVGRNATIGREDAVIFTFRLKPPAPRVPIVSLTVTALGGFRADYGTAKAPDAERVLAAATVSDGFWTMEAVIPFTSLDAIGFLSVERVRVPRPEAPELRWQYPAANDRADFALAPAGPHEDLLPVPVTPARAVVSPRETPPRVLSEPAARMVHDQLRKRMAAQAEAERRAWETVRTREDWERFRDPRLQALRESFGPMPARTPLRPAVTRRTDLGDGFVIENVVYESRPHLLVTANLYLPAKISGRIPAVLVVHSHHNPRTQPELQDIGMTWARAGAAVLVMDQLGAGERVQSNPWPRESYHSRYDMGMQLLLAGDTLLKWMVWDLMRGIDFLLERPYIDPARIVMLGAVAAGGEPAAVTAALDPRVAAVIPFNFGEAGPEEHYTEGPRPYDPATADPGWGSWETTRNLFRSASGQFFPWFICASVAPRRFVYAFEVGWPKTVEEEPMWARYKRVFDLYGARENLSEVHGYGAFPGPGECNNVGTYLRKGFYPTLKRWLDIPIPADEYHNTRPDAELAALTPALAMERQPQPVAALAAALARWKRASAKPQSAASLRAGLAQKLGDIEPAGVPQARTAWTRDASGFPAEAVALETEPGIRVPVVLLKPAHASGRAPAVLAFAQQGKERFFAERSSDLKTLTEHGVLVAIAELRGTGESAEGANRGPTSMGSAGTELMLGGTLLGARLKDARAAFRYLAARPDVDPARIALWGDSFAPVNPQRIVPYEGLYIQLSPHRIEQAEPMGPIVALLAAIYEDRVRAVATRRGLVSYASVLEDRFCYIPLDVVVPGILELTDLPGIAAVLAPRPVLQQAQVDGRNRAAGTDDEPPGSLGAWLAKQVQK